MAARFARLVSPLAALALCAATDVPLDAEVSECRHQFYQDYTVEWAACRAVVGMGAAPARGAQGAPRAAVPKVIVASDKEWSEGVAVRKEKWLALNPGYEWRFFSDTEGEEWLAAAYGEATAALYRGIKDGPIRADFFRVFYLAREGGVWADVDVVPVAPIARFGADDATPWVPRSRNVGMLNPTVIVTPANHTTMLAAAEAYRRLAAEEYSYWAWSVVHIMGALMHRGWVMDTPAVEACPDANNAWTCFIGLELKGEEGQGTVRLFNNRAEDYDPNTHGWLSAEGYAAILAANATNSTNASATATATASVHPAAPSFFVSSPVGIATMAVGGATVVTGAAVAVVKFMGTSTPKIDFGELPDETLL